MVSHDHKFIFIHIPKCGGTAIERSFGFDPYKQNKQALIGQTRLYGRKIWLQHLTKKKLHHFLPLAKINSYFKFAFVRNPWARMVSEISWMLSVSVHAKDLKKHFDITEISQDSVLKYLTNKSITKAHHFLDEMPAISQYDHLMDIDGQIRMDYIGKLENVQSDMDKICEKINVKPFKIPTRNASKHDDYRKYYTDETQELLYNRYQQDIEVFNYQFNS